MHSCNEINLQKGEKPPDHLEKEEDCHDQYCHVCKHKGLVVLCDFCELVFHLDCVNPPLDEIPEDDWKCPVCKVSESRVRNKASPHDNDWSQVLGSEWYKII